MCCNDKCCIQGELWSCWSEIINNTYATTLKPNITQGGKDIPVFTQLSHSAPPSPTHPTPCPSPAGTTALVQQGVRKVNIFNWQHAAECCFLAPSHAHIPFLQLTNVTKSLQTAPAPIITQLVTNTVQLRRNVHTEFKKGHKNVAQRNDGWFAHQTGRLIRTANP